MKFAALLVMMLLVSHAFAAVATTSFTVQTLGSVHRSVDTMWRSGVDNESLGGSSGSILVTLPGETRYQTTDTVDATTGNFYNQSGYVEFENGGVFAESVSMAGSDPYQVVTGSHYGFAQKAQISTAKFVENADVSVGQQAAWDGAGMYGRDISYAVRQSRETLGRTYTFLTESNDHAVVGTNASGGAIVRPEFDFIDFSDSFITNDTALDINMTKNQTNVVSSHTGSL